MKVVDDFQANPSHATHLNKSDLIRCDSHNTGPIRATDDRQKSYVLELLMRSCTRFGVQTLNGWRKYRREKLLENRHERLKVQMLLL